MRPINRSEFDSSNHRDRRRSGLYEDADAEGRASNPASRLTANPDRTDPAASGDRDDRRDALTVAAYFGEILGNFAASDPKGFTFIAGVLLGPGKYETETGDKE